MTTSRDDKAPGGDATDRFGYAFGVAVGAAVVAGMGILGWLGGPWPQVVALVIVEVGAVGAGWLEAKQARAGWRALLLAAFSWAVFGVTCTAATIWYAENRLQIINIELFIPVLIGLVPFGLVRLVVWLATRKRAAAAGGAAPPSRFGALDAAIAVLVLAVPVAGWAAGSRIVAGVQAREEEAHTRHVLTFVADGQGGVSYQGRPVDRDEIAELCRRAAAEDQKTEVHVKTPKQLDHAALGQVGFGALSAGLNFVADPAQ